MKIIHNQNLHSLLVNGTTSSFVDLVTTNNIVEPTNKVELYCKLALVLCTIFYASNYMLTKDLQTQLAPSMIVFLRFAIATLCFLPSLLSYRGNLDVILGSIEIGIWSGLGFISQAFSLQFSTSSKVSFFTGIGVIMPPIFAYVTEKMNQLKKKNIENSIKSNISQNNINNKSNNKSTGISSSTSTSTSTQISPLFKSLSILSLIRRELSKCFPLSSIFALCGGIVMQLAEYEPPTYTDLSLLVSPFSFAMCFWRSDLLNKKHPNQSSFISGILLGTTTIMSIFWALWTKVFPKNGSEWVKLGSTLYSNKSMLYGFLYSGIITTALTAIIEQWSMNYVTSAQIALIYTLEPIFATIFSVVFLKESLTPIFMLGACFILSACVVDSLYH